MKRLQSIFMVGALVMSTLTFGQEESVTSPTSKGKIILGGSSSFNFASQKSTFKSDDFETDQGTNTSFSLAPSTGFFVVDNLAIGAALSFSSSKFKNDEFDSESTNTALTFLPFVRYYFSEGNIKPFLQGSAGLGSSNFKEDSEFSEESEFKSSIFAYGFDGGVAFFLNDNVSIDLGIGYASASSKPKDNNDSNRRVINSGFGFVAGFNIFL